jgi:hypothetical protein
MRSSSTLNRNDESKFNVFFFVDKIGGSNEELLLIFSEEFANQKIIDHSLIFFSECRPFPTGMLISTPHFLLALLKSKMLFIRSNFSTIQSSYRFAYPTMGSSR